MYSCACTVVKDADAILTVPLVTSVAAVTCAVVVADVGAIDALTAVTRELCAWIARPVC